VALAASDFAKAPPQQPWIPQLHGWLANTVYGLFN
jgi:hypothetical protein